MTQDNSEKPPENPPAKNKGGRPRKHPPKDPNAPKKKGGRPRKTFDVSGQLPGVPGGDLSDDQQYVLAVSSRNRQRYRIEALADRLYDAISRKVAAGSQIQKTDFELFERYELRLRLIDNDLIELRKTRLEERKLEQALRVANESKVAKIEITLMPPPPPIPCPYRAEDYVKREQNNAETEHGTDAA